MAGVKGLLAVIFLLAASKAAFAAIGNPPYVIGHRGASGLYPEHTITAYKAAIDQGADFIECDVVPTKDCFLICRHEPELNLTTDASKYYSDLAKTYEIDGSSVTGIFSIDLTYEQVKKLRAIQPRTYRNQAYNGKFGIPTLEEYIKLAQSAGRTVGIYPETKHPTFHDSKLKCFKEGSFSMAVKAVLEKYGYKGPINSAAWKAKPAFIQSFETENLKELAKATTIPLVQLLDEWDLKIPATKLTYGDLATASGLKKIAEYAQGLGPWKGSYLVVGPNNTIVSTNAQFIKNAHAAGLQLHPYTFRNEEIFLAWEYFGDPYVEYAKHFNELGIDGAFTDFPGSLRKFIDGTAKFKKPASG